VYFSQLGEFDDPWRCYEHNFTRIVLHHVAVHQHLQYLHVQHGLAGRFLDSRFPILSKPMSLRISLSVTDASLRLSTGGSHFLLEAIRRLLGYLATSGSEQPFEPRQSMTSVPLFQDPLTCMELQTTRGSEYLDDQTYFEAKRSGPPPGQF
jgi:hypothetical protein